MHEKTNPGDTAVRMLLLFARRCILHHNAPWFVAVVAGARATAGASCWAYSSHMFPKRARIYDRCDVEWCSRVHDVVQPRQNVLIEACYDRGTSSTLLPSETNIFG